MGKEDIIWPFYNNTIWSESNAACCETRQFIHALTICFEIVAFTIKVHIKIKKMYRIVRVHSTHTVYRQIQIYFSPRLTLLHFTLNLLFLFFSKNLSDYKLSVYTSQSYAYAMSRPVKIMVTKFRSRPPKKLFRIFYYNYSPSVLIIVSEDVLNARCCAYSCSPPFSGWLPSLWASVLFWLKLCASYLQGAHRLYRSLQLLPLV